VILYPLPYFVLTSICNSSLSLFLSFFLQELVDRCAALSAKPNTIQNLVESMNKLADTYHDVEGMLQDIKELIQVSSFGLLYMMIPLRGAPDFKQ
jgi:hypothetical protein